MYHAKHSTAQKLVLMKRHQDHAAMKEFIMRWRYSFNLRFKDSHKIQALKNMLVRKDTEIMRSRLYKWKALVLDLECQIQSRVMIQRFTYRTYLISLMNGWRRVTIDHKVKRLTLMNKAWKSLKVQIMNAKQRQREKILLNKENDVRWRKYVT